MAFDEATPRLLHGSPIEFTETAAECNEVVNGQLLATKQNDKVIEPGPVDFVEVPIAETPQFDVLNFSSERRAARDDCHE
jgi:hypothetical protein